MTSRLKNKIHSWYLFHLGAVRTKAFCHIENRILVLVENFEGTERETMVQVIIRTVFSKTFRDQTGQQRFEKKVCMKELVKQLEKLQQLMWRKKNLLTKQAIEESKNKMHLSRSLKHIWWGRTRKAHPFKYSLENHHHISFCTTGFLEETLKILNIPVAKLW